MDYMGEFIALSTVLCWTLSVQFFWAASKRVGAIPVNILRIAIALLLFSILLYIREGSLLPLHFPARAWILLSLSGIVGFFIGDIFLFKALVELGPRLTMLIQSLAAPTAAIIGWIFLGEGYQLFQWFGMVVTLTGVSIVIFERGKKRDVAKPLNVRQSSVSGIISGVIYGILAMFGQAIGLILSKAGMHVDSVYLDAFASTQIRAIAALASFILFFTLTRRWGNVKVAIGDKKAVMYTAVGAAIGPFLGVSLSLYALHYLTTGVASTFFSLIPICIIPFSVYLHKEHVSLQAIIGALLAVAGVYMLVQ